VEAGFTVGNFFGVETLEEVAFYFGIARVGEFDVGSERPGIYSSVSEVYDVYFLRGSEDFMDSCESIKVVCVLCDGDLRLLSFEGVFVEGVDVHGGTDVSISDCVEFFVVQVLFKKVVDYRFVDEFI